MEQTIKNMELLLFNIKKELGNKNYNESKTIMNTYRTLLKRFTYLLSSDKRIDEYRITLDNQKSQLQLLHQRVEKNVESAIVKSEYKCADTLVEVSWRLERASTDIEDLIHSREKYVKDNIRTEMLNMKRFK